MIEIIMAAIALSLMLPLLTSSGAKVSQNWPLQPGGQRHMTREFTREQDTLLKHGFGVQLDTHESPERRKPVLHLRGHNK